jgi:hypothetical protein
MWSGDDLMLTGGPAPGQIAPVVGLITTLILDANDIERHGAAMLANFLKTNDHVECLSLKWNMIGTWCALASTSGAAQVRGPPTELMMLFSCGVRL